MFYGTAMMAGPDHEASPETSIAAPLRTQSGPMLVIDGKLHPAIDHDGTSKKTRNAVGVDRAGRAHFVISEAPISFGKLARYFRDRLETPNALFLDGSVSQLWDPGRERMDGGPELGPLIVVENRAKASR